MQLVRSFFLVAFLGWLPFGYSLHAGDKLPEAKKPQVEGTIPDEWIKTLKWRSLGPGSMGGRITAISVYEPDPTTYYVATASGGLLKTTNNGVTFAHQFDRESTVSIGDVCVAPSNRDIVWVGTGENNPRNSVSYGDGVYKSVDGGKTWKNMGLKKTFQIGKIVIHPKNPDIVYVGALGRLYGPNEERGLFKTSDGGKTWEKIFYVDDKTGVIDLAMSPADPDTLLVATWERRRDGFDSHPGTEMRGEEGYNLWDPIKKWGPGSGLYRTIDGGKNFKKLTTGLPTCNLGRIGLDYYRKDPRIIYAIVDSEKTGMGLPPPRVYLGVEGDTTPAGVQVTKIIPDSPAAKAGLAVGDLLKQVGKKEIKAFANLFQALEGTKADDKITVKLQRGDLKVEATVQLKARPGGDGDPPGRLIDMLGFTGKDEKDGVVVEGILDDGAAVHLLKPGDLIKSLDKKNVVGYLPMLELIRGRMPGEQITLEMVRGNETKEITLTLKDMTLTNIFGQTRLRPNGAYFGGQAANAEQGPDSFQYGGVYRSADGGETWTRVNSLNPRPMYFSQIRVDPGDDKLIYVLGVELHRSKDGGKTFDGEGGKGTHPDHHALWIDPKDGRRMILGGDGGVYATHDRMAHWDFMNHVAIGQFYHVAVDGRKNYRVYGGLQDNGTWSGPSRSLAGHGMLNEDWQMVNGGDGFQVQVDPTDPDQIYLETQDGGMSRFNLRTGARAGIRPKRESGQPGQRFNWNTPFILSSHNPKIYYVAGQFVYRSVKLGDDLKAISPEITRTKRGSATALAESPRNADVLWAGTDDGALWVTRDGGQQWTNVASKIPLPGPRWVASIEASRFAEGRAYVALDGHRSDDDEPYVFMTDDFGQSWKSLRGNLPWGSTRVLREDLKNKDVLYLGTEFAAWVSINRGSSWTRINSNLPTVALHEIAQHPTMGEMVAATHGRSLWALEQAPLRQMTPDIVKAKAHLFEPNVAVRFRAEPPRLSPWSGSRRFQGDNPPSGAPIYYSLNGKVDKVTLKVVDFAGKTINDLETKSNPGLHRVDWNYRAANAPPGMYRILMNVDGQDFEQNLKLEAE